MNKLSDIYKKIEELNLETIELKKSKEYLIGKRILTIKKYLKKLQIRKLMRKIIDNKKISKYSHEEVENNYKSVERNTKVKPKIAVYTCITGNYDKEILEPFIKVENIDFYLFTDNIKQNSQNWCIRPIPKNIVEKYNNVLKNRYLKMHPYDLFKDYDYSIYIDGNVRVMSDITELVYSINKKVDIAMHNHQFRDCIYDEVEVCKIKKKGNYKEMKKQIEKYKEEGFPKHFGMLEATIIVADLKSEIGKKFLNDWWKEFISTESFRDQISLQYVVWKNNYKISDFCTLGNNLYRNPKFRVNIH